MKKEKIIQVEDIQVQIHKKYQKHILRILPPDGQAKVSVPKSVSDDFWEYLY